MPSTSIRLMIDNLIYNITRKLERFTCWIAYKLPRKLVMRCYFRVIAHATTGKYSSTVVPELTAMEAIDRWNSRD